jgi:hypothetical protein
MTDCLQRCKNSAKPMILHPYVGLIVDYYPSPSERHAAIIVEVHGNEPATRPQVNLRIFSPNSKDDVYFRNHVRPVEKDSAIETEGPELEGRWGYAHEFAILQEPDHDEMTELGTNSNLHVGQVSGQISYEY